MKIVFDREEAKLLYELLRHRALELRTKAAYVAYSSAWNNSPKRVEERRLEIEAAEEMERVLQKFKDALGIKT